MRIGIITAAVSLTLPGWNGANLKATQEAWPLTLAFLRANTK